MKITFLRDHQSRLSGNEFYRTGTKADLPDAHAVELVAQGVVAAGWGRLQPAPAVEPEPIDYETLTVAELQAIARERNVSYSGLRKAELIEALS